MYTCGFRCHHTFALCSTHLWHNCGDIAVAVFNQVLEVGGATGVCVQMQVLLMFGPLSHREVTASVFVSRRMPRQQKESAMHRDAYLRPIPRASSSSSTTAVNCITHARGGQHFQEPQKIQIGCVLRVCVHLSSWSFSHLNIERLQHPRLVDAKWSHNEAREAKATDSNRPRFAPGVVQELVDPKCPRGPPACRGRASTGSQCKTPNQRPKLISHMAATYDAAQTSILLFEDAHQHQREENQDR